MRWSRWRRRWSWRRWCGHVADGVEPVRQGRRVEDNALVLVVEEHETSPIPKTVPPAPNDCEYTCERIRVRAVREQCALRAQMGFAAAAHQQP